MVSRSQFTRHAVDLRYSLEIMKYGGIIFSGLWFNQDTIIFNISIIKKYLKKRLITLRMRIIATCKQAIFS